MKKDEIQASFDPVYLLNNSPRFGRQFSRGITLAPHQQAMLQRCLQIERLPQINDTYGKVGIMGSRPGSGKCLGLNTPILMHDGSIKLVQDIVVGDQLMGDDSTPRNVLSLARGQDEMYDIIPVKGDKYTVNSEHILCLKCSGNHTVEYKKRDNRYYTNIFDNDKGALVSKCFRDFESATKFIELNQAHDQIYQPSVKQYLTLNGKSKHRLKGYRTGVDFAPAPVEFDPYIIGLWLGDGHSNGCVITNQDSAILHYLNKTLPSYNMRLEFNKSSKYAYGMISNTRKSVSPLLMCLRKHNLINNKHIPHVYKCNDRHTRLAVLAGLIDSDGYLHDGTYDVVQKNKQLSDDILFLARTLGFAAYQKQCTKSCMYKGEKRTGTYYRVTISGKGLPYIPVKVRRKQANFTELKKDAMVTGITVEPVGWGDYYGFVLDGNHRFLLGDCTVTHNTATTLSLIAASKFNGDAGPDGLFVNLVVVPQAIMTQWKNELDNYNGNDNILTYKMFGEYADISGLYFKRDIIRDYDVLITHSMFYKVIVDVAKDIGLKLHRMIVDEIDGACWCVSGKANAEMTWYISATFADACESKGYIGQLMTTVPVHVIRDRVCICRDEFIDESFYLPDPVSTVVTCKNKHLDYLLTGFLTKPVLSCLNAGHYSSIKNKFHPVFAKNEQQVVGILMYNASETVRRTQQCLDDIIQRSNDYEKSSSQYPNITPEELTQMRKTIEDAKASEKEVRRVVQDNDLCLICFNFIGAVLATAPCCCSSFCSQCVHKHLDSNDTCPACHTGNLRKEDLFIESNSRPLDRSTVGGLHTKIDAVTEIVRNTDGNKVLIFSEYADCFDELEAKLSATKCKVLIMNKGDVDGINATVDAYRSAAEKCVLMVCSDHFGRGLNLEITSDIVFLHRMPETLTAQVIGRAQRLGRSGVLKLWHTLYENEA